MDPVNQNQDELLQELFISACEDHQAGNIQKAKEGYLKILEIADNPLLRYNLGLIYFDEGHFEQARDSFKAADSLHGGDVDTLFNLALSCKKSGQTEEAARIYTRIVSLDPQHIDALYNLAGCYRELKDLESAVNFYCEVLTLQPTHEASINNIAYSYHVLGRKKRALKYYRLLLELNPAHKSAKHMVNALEGRQIDHSPETYVRDIFDNYSGHYDESLVDKLGYSVPTKLRNMLDGIPSLPAIFNNGIDLGCGTGLSGESFYERVRIFNGVDLSPKMIEAAERKGIYSRLTVSSIQDALQQASDPFDFILAADVFIYVGRLDDLFHAISRSSRPGTLLCFSTETGDTENFHLRSTGRFAHAPEYIRTLSREYGWNERCHQKTDLRKEAGEWVSGDLWIFQATP